MVFVVVDVAFEEIDIDLFLTFAWHRYVIRQRFNKILKIIEFTKCLLPSPASSDWSRISLPSTASRCAFRVRISCSARSTFFFISNKPATAIWRLSIRSIFGLVGMTSLDIEMPFSASIAVILGITFCLGIGMRDDRIWTG